MIRAILPVSRETEQRLDRFADLLPRWQKIKNLVGPEALSTLWTRHIADSAQCLAVAPQARRWVDLGTGAGFPGLVIAAFLAEADGADVELVESNSRKCAFLRAAALEMNAPATIRCMRIEAFTTQHAKPVDVVSARALAPLSELLRMAAPLLTGGAIGLFHKGQDVERELTEAARYWRIDAELIPSRTSPHGRLVLVRDLAANGM